MKFLAGLLSIGLLASPAIAIAHGGHGGHHSKAKNKSSSTGATSSGRESHSVEHVDGYTKSDGTHVSGYDRTTANGTKADNWSTKGSVNPETGQPGEKPPR